MSGKNGNKKIGRNSAKCGAYKSSGIREQRKVKKILQSSGLEQARVYAAAKGLTSYLADLVLAQDLKPVWRAK